MAGTVGGFEFLENSRLGCEQQLQTRPGKGVVLRSGEGVEVSKTRLQNTSTKPQRRQQVSELKVGHIITKTIPYILLVQKVRLGLAVSFNNSFVSIKSRGRMEVGSARGRATPTCSINRKHRKKKVLSGDGARQGRARLG